jgi:hypothetical protein
MNWIPTEDEDLATEVRRLLKRKLEELSSSKYSSNNETKPEDDPLDIPQRSTPIVNELDLFLVDPDKSLESLHKYPRIKDLFIRFNTGLPSSAPVERFFSAGPLILTSRRHRLKDDFFETLLILKIHKGF